MLEIKKVKLELPADMVLPQGCELPEIEMASTILKRTIIQDDGKMAEIEEVIEMPIIQKFNKNPNSVVCVDIKTELQDVIRRIYESLPDFGIKGYSIEVIDPICINYNNKGYLKFQVIRRAFDGNLINDDTYVVYSIEDDEIVGVDSQVHKDIVVDTNLKSKK